MIGIRNLAPAIVAALLFSLPGPAPAREADGQTWKVACDAGKACQLSYTQSNDDEVVTRILIYEVGGRTVLEYLVPLRIDLQKGIALRIDGEMFPTKLLYCDAPGCVGFAVLGDGLLARMKAGATLGVVFSPHDRKRAYAFEYSLQGFTAAWRRFASREADAAAAGAFGTLRRSIR